MNLKLTLAVAVCLSMLPLQVAACETKEMMKAEAGFIMKVVARSDKINAYTDASASEEAFQLELLQPYFVICEEGDYYQISESGAQTVEEALAGLTGYVERAQVAEWATREALSFSDIAFLEERQEIRAWADEATIREFLDTGDDKLHPPSFRENLSATRARKRETRPYPVLGSFDGLLMAKAEKRVFNVLLPVALPPTATVEIAKGDVDATQAALSTATIIVVFDATASMGEFALQTATAISNALTSIPAEVRDGSSMGFVFYRDSGDPEPVVTVDPLPLADAAEALKKAAAFMSGGGDAAEPVLDATYIASNLVNWGQTGRKLMIVVLNDDAKPATIGDLDVQGRVPVGQDVYAVVRGLYEKSIPVLAVQAGPNAGPNLISVLQTMADETGGQFFGWSGSVDEKAIAGAVVERMSADAGAAIAAGEGALERMKFDLNGFATIPLEVMDAEMMDRLSAAGVNFNINAGVGGVLVEEGYLLENNDLLAPQVQMDKETLSSLVNLFGVLATVGPDEENLVDAMSEAVAAIAGEGFDPKEPLEEILAKRLGIQFRTDLLNATIDEIAGMTSKERLAWGKRVQDAQTSLSQYLEANQAEFDTQVAVWMPTAMLP